MPRPHALAVAALALCAAVAQAQKTEPPKQPLVAAATADVAWDDPAYARFFKYQAYLNKSGLSGETKETWAKLKPAERVKKATEGEAFLRGRLEAILQEQHLSDEDQALLTAVWGAETAKGAQRVALARRTQDPAQVELALKSVKSLVGKAAEKIDWNNLFDGAHPGADAPVDPAKDPLATPEKKPFLASLASEETQRIIASRKTYQDFLKKHSVAPTAIPAMMAMYDVITKAGPAEKKELSHILPTIVRFLKDGKPIVLENMEGAYGFAVPGKFDKPEKVAVTPLAAGADPVLVADVLTHEFQHIYDMYTGRYYSLDSEMRGFKSNVAFYRAMKDSPSAENKKKLVQMMDSDDDTTRHYANHWKSLDAKLRSSPRDFSDEIAFGHGYNHTEEGTFSGRLPLREAADKGGWAERELSKKTALRDEADVKVKELEGKQKAVLAAYTASPTRENDKALEKVASDLRSARASFAHYEDEVTIRTIRLNRMRSEVAWLDKKGAGQKDADPYDLRLQVDDAYMTP